LIRKAAPTHIITGITIMTGDKRILRTARRQGEIVGEKISPDALYRIMIWLSPTYPVGAFAYSTGIEWAVENGDVDSATTLREWLESMLTEGAGITDGVFFSHIHRAVGTDDMALVVEIVELAAAFVPSRERLQETATLGRAFIEVTQAAWPCTALTKLVSLWDGPIAYPIAVGTACAGHDIPLPPALRVFLTALCTNWVSAGVRLIPLGHTAGQCVLRALEPAVFATAQRALATRLDYVASTTFRADLASARHETQYTRLFRS
jgi:urease accessory protein